MRRRLTVVPLGPIRSDPDLPGWLAGELERILAVEPRLAPTVELLDAWLDRAGSRRYQSNRIVDSLLETLVEPASTSGPSPDGQAWTLGLTEADLVAPGREFVFGEATFGGPVALVSIARLGSADATVLHRRVLKEALHEIGHLAGLEHCTDRRCVMFPSAGLPETDAKLAHPCDACRPSYPLAPAG